MSVMFRPPMAAGAVIGWRELLGFVGDREPFAAQVRAIQIAAVYRYVPINVVLLGLNVVAIVAALWPTFDHARLIGLGGAMSLVSGLWLLRWWYSPTGPDAPPASARLFWLVTAEVLAFGILWAAFIIGTLPEAATDLRAILLIGSLVAMGATGFSTAVMPVAGIGIVVVIAVSTLIAIPAGDPLDRTVVDIAFVSFTLLIARGVLITTLAMMARMRAQVALGDHAAVISLLLNEFEANGSDWLFELDEAGRLTHVSPRMAAATRRSREALLGAALLSVVGDGADEASDDAVQTLAAHLNAEQAFRDLVVPVRAGDETRWWSISATAKTGDSGRFHGFRGVAKDITEMRRSQARIAQLARFDPLTGLANRTLFREALDDELGRARRGGRDCALLFVDLDRFKQVNDSLGHVAGDRLLREVAARLTRLIPEGAQIGRLGGDEFAIILPDATARKAEALARHVVAALAEPFVIDGARARIGASVGYALGPGDGDTVELLLKSADLALYEVKTDGRGAACRFVPEIGERAAERRVLETDLSQALARNELALAFQPVVDATTETVVAFEALLRWRHPRLGLIPPLKFIPIAEETGLILPIGEWVIRTACAWASEWPEHIRVAVNLSPAQFEDERLVETVRSALAENRVAPDRLELEITESLFLDEKPATMQRLAELKALGVHFALDDFGTGYSSLGYLQKVAFSRIKIDRSFVARATQADSEATAIIQAIVSLAHRLNMETTAEGTETREEFDACRELGCMHMQGWLFGKPMPPEDATALVRPREAVLAG